MLDFAKKMLEKVLISAFSSPLKQTAWEHESVHGRNTREQNKQTHENQGP